MSFGRNRDLGAPRGLASFRGLEPVRPATGFRGVRTAMPGAAFIQLLATGAVP